MLYNLLANNKRLFIKVIAERKILRRNIKDLYLVLISKVPSNIKRLTTTNRYFGKEIVELSMQDMLYIICAYTLDCPTHFTNCGRLCGECKKYSLNTLLENKDAIAEVVEESKLRYGE